LQTCGWKKLQFENPKRLVGHEGEVISVTYSPDGEYIASGSRDGTVEIWRVATGEEVRTLGGHTDVVTSVSYSPNGEYIASGSWDGTVKIWRVATGEVVRTLTRRGFPAALSVAYSPNGEYIASGSMDGTVKIWRVSTGEEEEVRTLTGHTGPVFSVAYSPNGEYAASTSEDGRLIIWDVSTGNQVITLQGKRSVSFSPDGAAVASGMGRDILIWTNPAQRLFNQIASDPYSFSSNQLLLLYALFQFYLEQESLQRGGEIPLRSIQEALEMKYGQNVPWILDLVLSYRTLPTEIRELLNACFRVVDRRNPAYPV
jgi:WD40 repeat protein